MRRALADEERGLGAARPRGGRRRARDHRGIADGDARSALNVLELSALHGRASGRGRPRHRRDVAQGGPGEDPALRQEPARSTTTSSRALHKSLRDSDPDAALYWLARMLEAGEDPLYIARRLVRFASEDVGNADPQALPLCVAAMQACHFVGMPEGDAGAGAGGRSTWRPRPRATPLYAAYGEVKADVRKTARCRCRCTSATPPPG